jgi:opacity protein-like surface antigen
MKKLFPRLMVALIMLSNIALAQDVEESNRMIIRCATKPPTQKTFSQQPGMFELGVRSTASLFGDAGNHGLGAGGQFRLRFHRQIGSEWFADYIVTDIDGLGKREDAHIGWSVMFYPFPAANNRFSPYLLAGHCFDYTKVTSYSSPTVTNLNTERWSSAIQMGIGTHYNLNKWADISLSVQYMTHLGNDIHTRIIEENGLRYLTIDDHSHGASLEGHILATLSFNIKIGRLWKGK